MRRFKLREALSTSLWFIPLLCVLGAIVLYLLASYVDRRHESWGSGLVFKGSAEGAHELLGAITSSVITFTAVVFSVTIVALQLASQQFSPRVLRTFLRDRPTQLTLGLFVATLTYAVLVLRDVRVETSRQEEFVPRLSVMLCLVVLAVSIAMFVVYLHHTARSLRVSTIIQSVAGETRAVIERLLPDEPDPPSAVPRLLAAPVGVVRAERHGVVAAVSHQELARHASHGDVVVAVVPAIGDFVPRGAPLLEVYGNGDHLDERQLCGAVAITRERTMRQDPSFGFRQIVDIAVRALSPGVNDPTTAVQCLDELHDLLRIIGQRPAWSGQVRDGRGEVRVLVPQPTWSTYLSLALDEIRTAGARQLQITRRMRALLDDLEAVVPEERRAAVRVQIGKLDLAVVRSFGRDGQEEDLASAADPQGIGGSRRDLVTRPGAQPVQGAAASPGASRDAVRGAPFSPAGSMRETGGLPGV